MEAVGSAVAAAETEKQLFYGDIVYLEWHSKDAAEAGEESERGPYLFADGFLEAKAVQNVRCLPLIPGGTDSMNCAFRLCWPVSYDHHKQLSLAKKFSNVQSAASLAIDQRNRDEKTKEADRKNAELMTGNVGEQFPLHYNDKVQLEHVLSSKLLTLQENSVADLDPMNLKVGLSNGSEGSIFEIIGLYRIQIAGSPVFSSKAVLLRNVRLGDSYLHTTTRQEGDTPAQREVDLSTRKEGDGTKHDGWTLYPYQHHAADDAEHLLLGRPVALMHTEVDMFVACGDGSTNPDPGDALDATPDSTTLKIYYVFESAEQGSHRMRGGKVKWDTPYRLRHLASGHYLAAGDGSSGKLRLLPLEESSSMPDASAFLFAITPAQKGARRDNQASHDCVCLFEVRQTGCRLENRAGNNKTWVHKIEGRNKFVLSSTMHDEDGYSIVPLPEEDAPELHRVGSFIRSSEEYLEAFLRPHDRTAMNVALTRFHGVLVDVTQWLSDGKRDRVQQDIIRDLGFLDVMMWAFLGPWLYLHRSGGMQAEGGDGTDGSIVDLGTGGSVGVAAGAGVGADEGLAHLTEEDELPETLFKVQKELCGVLKSVIRGNERSQLYFAQRKYSSTWTSEAVARMLTGGENGSERALRVADGSLLKDFAKAEGKNRWVEALTNQLQWRAGVGGIFVCMMENNLAVLNDHINDALLFKFLQWMRKRGPFAQWLNVLTVVCVCNNQRVAQLQEGVMRMLLSVRNFEGQVRAEYKLNRPKLFIETILDTRPEHRRYYAPNTVVKDYLKLIGKTESDVAPAAAASRPMMPADASPLTSLTTRTLSPTSSGETPRATIALPLSAVGKPAYAGLKSFQVPTIKDIHFYNVEGVDELLLFETDVCAGIASVVPSKWASRGRDFDFVGAEILGKQMYLEGVSRLLVGFCAEPVGDDGEPNIFTQTDFFLQETRHVKYPGLAFASHSRRNSSSSSSSAPLTSADGPPPSSAMILQRRQSGPSVHGLLGADWQAEEAKGPSPPEPYNDFRTMRWYPAEELLWVLQPDQLCPKGKAWWKNQGERESRVQPGLARFKHQVAVAEHYEEQIRVVANMCFGGNMACIKVAEQMFSFDLVFAAMSNEKLPKSTRTAFVELMIHLYISVDPHYRLRVPNFIRLYGDLRNDFILGDGRERALPHAPMELVKRLRLLKFFTSDYLLRGDKQIGEVGEGARNETHNISNQGEQCFILSLVKMCRCIADHGFYSTAKGIKAFLCNPLLKALDGRLDQFGEEMTGASANGNGANSIGVQADDLGLGHLADRSSTERYAVTPVTEPPMRVKSEICQVMLQVARIRLDYRLSKLLHGFHFLAEREIADDGQPGRRGKLDHSMLMALQRQAAARREDTLTAMNVLSIGGAKSQKGFGRSVAPPKKSRRVNNDKQSAKVNANKVSPAASNSNGEGAGAGPGEGERKEEEGAEEELVIRSQLLEIMPWINWEGYNTSIAVDSERLFEDLFVELFHNKSGRDDPNRVTLDFELMTEGPFVTICLDLLMYESPELFSTVISLLVRKFTTKAKLRQKLARMQVLVRKGVLENYNTIKSVLVHLQSSMNSFPVWAMGNFPQLPKEVQETKRATKREEVLESLRQLEAIARTEPVAVHQDVLRRAGTVEVVLGVLRVRRRICKPDQTKARIERIGQHNVILDEICIQCHAFLQAFAEGHSTNQQVLYEQIDYFVRQIQTTEQLPAAGLQGGDGGADSSGSSDSGGRVSNEAIEQKMNAVLRTTGVIFEGNAQLVQKVPPAYVETLLRGMWARQGTPVHFAHAVKYVGFFIRLCEVHQKVVPSNQLLLIDLFTGQRAGRGLDAITDQLLESFKNHARRAELALAFERQPEQDSQGEGEREGSGTGLGTMHELRFHLQLLRLFVSISRGSTERVHAKMRAICTLRELLSAMCENGAAESALPATFQLLCEFFTEVYLCSELEEAQQLGSNRVFAQLLSAWACMLRRFMADYAEDETDWSLAAVAHQRCIIRGVLPCCIAYIESLGPEAAEQLLTRSHNGNAQLVAELVDLIERFKDHSLHRRSSSHIAAAAAEAAGPSEAYSAAEVAAMAERTKLFLRTYGELDEGDSWRPQRKSRRKGAQANDGDVEGENEDSGRQPVQLECFDRFVSAILGSEFVQQRVVHEFDELAAAMENVHKLTDPHDDEYQRQLSSETKSTADQRRNAITFDELLARLLRHMQSPEQMAPSADAEDEETRVALLVLLRRLVERRLCYGVGDDETHWEPLLLESAIKPSVPATLESAYRTTEEDIWRLFSAILEVLDSLPGTLFIILVVILAISLPTEASAELLGDWVLSYALEYCFLVFFALEVSVRLSCVGWYRYFTDPICIVDFVSTVLEIFVLVYEEATGQKGFAHATMGRLMRGLRVFRLTKAMRFFDAMHQLIFGSSTAQHNADVARASHREQQVLLTEAGVLDLVVATLERTDIATAVRLESTALGARLLEYGNPEVQQAVLHWSHKHESNALLRNSIELMRRASDAAVSVVATRCERATEKNESGGGGTGDSKAGGVPGQRQALQSRLKSGLEGLRSSAAMAAAAAGSGGGAAAKPATEGHRRRRSSVGRLGAGTAFETDGDGGDGGDGGASARGISEVPLLSQPSETGGNTYSALLHEAALTFRLLQQMVEGHNLKLQHFLREQTHTDVSVNAIEAAGNLFCAVVGDQLSIKYGLGHEEVRLLVHTLDFLIDALQGPCFENQQVLATKTRMLETISVLLDSRFKRGCEPYFAEPFNPTNATLLDSKRPWWRGMGGDAHALAFAYSPTLLKGRCARFLSAMVEGVTNEKLITSIRGALSHLSVRNRLKELFCLESYFARAENMAVAESHLVQAVEKYPFDTVEAMRQMILNAAPGDWATQLSEEGQCLTIVALRLERGSGGEAFAEGLHGKAEDSEIGTDQDIRSYFNEAAEAYVLVKDACKVAREELDFGIDGGAGSPGNEALVAQKTADAFVEGSRMLSLLGSSMAEHFKGVSRSAKSAAATARRNLQKSNDEASKPTVKRKFSQIMLGKVRSQRKGRTVRYDEELKQLQTTCRKAHEQAMHRRSQLFFRDRLARVEIVWRDELHTIHYNCPDTKKYMQHLSAELEKTEEATAEDKLLAFVARCTTEHRFLNFSIWLDVVKIPLLHPLTGSLYDVMASFEQLEAISFSVAFCNALLMLIGLQNHSATLNMRRQATGIAWAADFEVAKTLNLILGVMQVLLCAMVLFIQLLRQFPKLVLTPFQEFLRREKGDSVKLQDQVLRVAREFLPSPLAKSAALFTAAAFFCLRYAKEESVERVEQGMDVRFVTTYGYQTEYLYVAAAAVVPIILVEIKRYIGTPSSIPSLIFVVVYDMLLNPAIIFNWLLLAMACLGLFYMELFYCFHLLKAATLSPEIQNVGLSVFRPFRTLALTLALAAIVIYQFTVVAFYLLDAMPPDFRWEDQYGGMASPCSTLASCFLFIFHKGMINGGGILFAGEYADGGLEYESSTDDFLLMLFDLLFYLGVSVAIMNMVFGIMIDTFATLRDEQMERDDQRQNYCFMCCQNRSEFESQVKFQHHREVEHNVLNYLYFITAVLETDADDRNGYESYVHDMIAEGRVEWLPINRAASLEEESKGGAGEAGADDDGGESVEQAVRELGERFENLERETHEGLRRIEQEQGKKLAEILSKLTPAAQS